MCKKLILFFVIFCLLLFESNLLLCQEKEMILGGNEGWGTFSVVNHVALGPGRFGNKALYIAHNMVEKDFNTDLLINFENKVMSDVVGNYKTTSDKMNVVEESFMGSYSGLSRGQTGLRLRGSTESIFGKSGVIGSFSISFWLNPNIAENGETVFSWSSSRNRDNDSMYQMIQAAFFNNRLEWSFTNVFFNLLAVDDESQSSESQIVLKSNSLVIPFKWAYHTITFDEETGLMEYRIDGKVEDMRYITSSGRGWGTVFSGMLGVPADIEICPNFMGKIDDFAISRSPIVSEFSRNRYIKEGGRVESQPLGPYRSGTIIDKVLVDATIPSQTDVQVFIRGSDNYFEWTNNTQEWIPVKNGVPSKEVAGEWFQVAVDMYTDGLASVSPYVSEIKLVALEKNPPMPPFKLYTQSGNGYIDISWVASASSNADGYYLYYGTAPGEYLGQISIEGASPIDVKNKLSYRLTGLKNGQIYYVAVSAYDEGTMRIEGGLSSEVHERPLLQR